MKPRDNQEIAQNGINWQSFFSESNVPILGYDPINDQIIIKRGADYSGLGSTSSHDIYIYDMKTGSWTKSMNGFADNIDVTNFVINSNSQLVCKASNDTTTTIYAWRPDPQATSTLKFKTKAYDFNYPALKKKLYKVVIHAKKGENTVIKIGYDNAEPTNLFTSNTFNTDAALKKNEFIVTTPAEFSYITIQIESNGTTHADFEINDIALVYRMLSAH